MFAALPVLDFSHIDLTVNFFTTPLFILLLGMLIKRWLRALDEKQAIKDAATVEWRSGITKKIDAVCDDNKEEHATIWNKLNHHAHTDDGKVIDTT